MSSKFCKDARNQLSHRKIAKKSIMRARGEPHLTLPPQQQDRENEVDSDNAEEDCNHTNHKSQNHNKEFQYKKMKSHII